MYHPQIWIWFTIPTHNKRLKTVQWHVKQIQMWKNKLTPTAGETVAMEPSVLNPQMFIIGLYYYTSISIISNVWLRITQSAANQSGVQIILYICFKHGGSREHAYIMLCHNREWGEPIYRIAIYKGLIEVNSLIWIQHRNSK